MLSYVSVFEGSIGNTMFFGIRLSQVSMGRHRKVNINDMLQLR